MIFEALFLFAESSFIKVYHSHREWWMLVIVSLQRLRFLTFSSITILIHSLRSKQLWHNFKHWNTHQSSFCHKRLNSWLKIMTIWDKKSRIIKKCMKSAYVSSERRRRLWKSFDEWFLIIETCRERLTLIFVSSSVLENEMKNMWSYDERLCVRL